MTKFSNIKFNIGNTSFVVTYSDYNGITATSWFAEYHAHAVAEIHIMHNGSVCLKTEGNNFFLNENDVCIVPPRVYHAVSPITKRVIKASLYLEIKKNNLKTEDTFSSFSVLLNEPKPLFFQCSSMYINELIRISQNEESSFITFCRLQNLFSIVFTEIYDKIYLSSPRKYQCEGLTYQTEVLLEIENAIDLADLGNITLESIAKQLNLSTTQLSRIIKKNFHTSFREFILGYKLRRAKDLLKASTMSLNEIAVSCGYETYAGFFRTFKKLEGMSPEQYRNAE